MTKTSSKVRSADCHLLIRSPRHMSSKLRSAKKYCQHLNKTLIGQQLSTPYAANFQPSRYRSTASDKASRLNTNVLEVRLKLLPQFAVWCHPKLPSKRLHCGKASGSSIPAVKQNLKAAASRCYRRYRNLNAAASISSSRLRFSQVKASIVREPRLRLRHGYRPTIGPSSSRRIAATSWCFPAAPLPIWRCPMLKALAIWYLPPALGPGVPCGVVPPFSFVPLISIPSTIPPNVTCSCTPPV